MVLALNGCTTSPEKDSDSSSDNTDTAQAQTVFDDPFFDGVYVVPGVDFSRYDALMVTELDLEQWRPQGRELPLEELNRNDQQYFRQEYSEAVVHYLVAQGGFELSLDAEPNVLRVDANLRQTLQPPLDEGRAAPRGSIIMLLTLELVDSSTGQLVGTLSNRQAIDRSMNERNSPLTTMQVSEAFAQWMRWFRGELNELRRES